MRMRFGSLHHGGTARHGTAGSAEAQRQCLVLRLRACVYVQSKAPPAPRKVKASSGKGLGAVSLHAVLHEP